MIHEISEHGIKPSKEKTIWYFLNEKHQNNLKTDIIPLSNTIGLKITTQLWEENRSDKTTFEEIKGSKVDPKRRRIFQRKKRESTKTNTISVTFRRRPRQIVTLDDS